MITLHQNKVKTANSKGNYHNRYPTVHTCDAVNNPVIAIIAFSLYKLILIYLFTFMDFFELHFQYTFLSEAL